MKERALSKLLYLEASPRQEQSYSSRAAKVFLDTYTEQNPDDTIDHFHLFEDELAVFDREAADQKMAHIQRLVKEGKGIEPVGKWAAVVEEINRLKSADKIVISSPMWNFSIPYPLKQWIDIIVQPGLTFGVNRRGQYVGMLRDKRLQLILASGSAYPSRFPLAEDAPKTDFQTCYLQHIANYIGIEDVRKIHVGPTEALPPDEVKARFDAVLDDVRKAAQEF